MSSYFQMKCTAQVYPLASDIWWPNPKWFHIFRWSVHAVTSGGQEQGTFRWCVQRRMSSYFQMKCSCSGQEQGTFRQCVQEQSHLQVYCHLQVPPSEWYLVANSSIIFRWCVQLKFTLSFPPVLTSGEEEQHEVRSWWPWLRVMMTLSFTPLFIWHLAVV